MKFFIQKKGKLLIITSALLALATPALGQVRLTPDTLECHIVSFSAGLMMPGSGSNSAGLTQGNMRDLYPGPYLNFGLEWNYKYKSNWMLCFDGDFWFGTKDASNNLQQRNERLGDIYTHGGYAMGWGGYDGVVTAYNRSLSARPGIARIVTFLPQNPNSGLLLKLSGGWFMQKTVFNQDPDRPPVYQLRGDYQHLYDHLRNGVILTESVGFVFMSNYSTYINVKLTFELSQCWSWESRPYTIDNVMGVNGKDHSRYFDLLYGLRLTWMFPFTGKPTYDYYYY